MIDTHCHLQSPRFNGDREQVLSRARVAGVSQLVVAAVGPDDWPLLLRWAQDQSDVHVALGIHPRILPQIDPADDARHLANLRDFLGRGQAKAIGECGLDATVASQVSMERQQEVLQGHLTLARLFRLPVVLHCLKAHQPLLKVLGAEPLPAGGMMHSYSGSAEQVADYLDFGLYFSFAGSITHQRAKKPLAAIKAVPGDRLLMETDAPDQTPQPFGGRNEPAYLACIAEKMAEALGMSVSQLTKLTDDNARRLFCLS